MLTTSVIRQRVGWWELTGLKTPPKYAAWGKRWVLEPCQRFALARRPHPAALTEDSSNITSSSVWVEIHISAQADNKRQSGTKWDEVSLCLPVQEIRMPAATSLCPLWLLPGWGSQRLIHCCPAVDSLREEGKKLAPGDAGCSVEVWGRQDANCQGLESRTWARRQLDGLYSLSAKMGMS